MAVTHGTNVSLMDGQKPDGIGVALPMFQAQDGVHAHAPSNSNG
jgi:hypothetical protein